MQQKFKIGDRVKATDHYYKIHGELVPGTEGNVIDLWGLNRNPVVDFSETMGNSWDCAWMLSHELELVQEDLEVKETRDENGWAQREMVVGVSSVVAPRSSWAEDMTLRDQFAMAALTGLMSAHASDGTWSTMGAIKEAAKFSYDAADAMLEARKKH